MAVLSLPLNFNNSFWTHDYRRGLEVLYNKLEQGVAENEEIVTFIRSRAIAEGALATSLTVPMPTGAPGSGFGADDGASLLHTFIGLQAESVAQGKAHQVVSKELHTLVADPFDVWARGYQERVKQSRAAVVEGWLRSYEHAQADVAKLKQQYLAKTRRADEAEDDAKFAPNSGGVDNYTSSPRLRAVDGRAPPQRTASVSERIALRLKELQKKAMSVAAEDPNHTPQENAEEPVVPKLDKGKGKATDDAPGSPPILASPPPMSPLPEKHLELPPASPIGPPNPSPILLAGLAFTPASLSKLLLRASHEMHLRPVRFPLLGEYQDCFTGEEIAAWLNEHVPGFGGDLDRAEDAARDLTEREGLLRRIGELGNQFELSDEAFYQFRPKAFDLEGKTADANPPAAPAKPFDIMKRTGNFANLVSKALNANPNGEPAYVRARREAEEADKAYRIAVRRLDRQRLGLEDKIEENLKTLQRWESERLSAVKTVLLQYHATLANLPKSLEPSLERSSTCISAYQPENDLTALIERYRTGPFRPHAHVYESVAHDDSDVVFGIDLRKWAEGSWTAMTTGEEKKELVPRVLTTLLNALKASYQKLENDDEKRKSWIYEVPLPAAHHLREALNGLDAEQAIPANFFDQYDAAVIASTLKLWILELDPPVALWEGWDDIRKLYPTVGHTETEKGKTDEQRIQDISAALQKLPRVHLYVLDAVVSHLKELVASTKVEEADEVYITKLALSVGRTIVRPKVETELSIQDRHPTLMFIDLLKHYDAILPPTIARKKRESERKVPIRKRTAPIDMRLSRSRISVGADAKQLLAAQQQAQNPSLVRAKSPPLPPQTLPSMETALASPPPPVEKPVVQAPPPPPPIAEPALVAPPPPPPIVSQPAVPSPPPTIPSPPVKSPEDPPRPAFKEPPPEIDDLPPRPSFKEPPPEIDDLPPRPTFTEPPVEEPTSFTPPGPPPPITNVTPPTPQSNNLKRVSATYRSNSPSPTKIASRSPSPPGEDRRSTLSRSSSGQSAAIRGPRGARGPRAPGSVTSIVQNLNRSSVSGSPPGTSPTSPDPRRLSGSPARRSSVLNRTSAFSRRTMASDAEDDIVDKK
ncbi:hypothetical protein CCMSSC00406_0004464 [Pleurotus cornucopiae]|uniref:Uncharacterized protein n=1 Tax=Pleurotus cornucopiae TaxID=5321 RepID=A0ACB7J1N0_PLECO|nr:hypothetical protein CCMSSC00406_0004464 [Pleurotus cornucopiae]